MPTPSIITVSLNPAVDRVLEVERFTVGAHQVGREVLRIAGGKAINVSRVLAALEVRSVATGFLGEENRGSFESVLRNPLIVNEFFPLPGRTRENVTIADRASGQETHIRDVGLQVAPRFLERLEKKLRLLETAGSIVIFSGSLPPGITAAEFARLVESCTAADARVAVDTSGDALRAVAGRDLWLVKPNAAELSLLVGQDLPSRDEQLQAARSLTSTVENVLFTRGAEGAWCFTRELALHGRAAISPEQVRNTVGCGDALLGAFVAGVSRETPLRETFRDAVACATASAMTLAPAEFDPAVFDELRGKVELTEL